VARNFGRRALQWLDLPPDALLDIPRLETVGHLQLRLSNHRGLMRYEPGLVVIRLPQGRLEVRGQDFVVGAIDREEILVTGIIRAIQFHVGAS
jgi:sporulation protein YqfC